MGTLNELRDRLGSIPEPPAVFTDVTFGASGDGWRWTRRDPASGEPLRSCDCGFPSLLDCMKDAEQRR